MPSLNQLIRNRATVEIPTADADDPLRIEYQPAALTPRLLAQLEEYDGMSRQDQMRLQASCLVAVVHQWNLNRADGSIIPLTVDAIMDEVDMEAQNMILMAVRTDARMGETNGAKPSTPSASTSSPTAKRATSRR